MLKIDFDWLIDLALYSVVVHFKYIHPIQKVYQSHLFFLG